MCASVSFIISIPIFILADELAYGSIVRSTPALSGQPSWNASKVVDGNTNTNVYCGSCLLTRNINNTTSAYFQIDLRHNYTISLVEIFGAQCYNPKNCSRPTPAKLDETGVCPCKLYLNEIITWNIWKIFIIVD